MIVGCLGLAASACASELTTVVQRASNEFACPREQVEVVRRNDIGPGMYDLDACGSRARYTCLESGDDSFPDIRCVREPDPPRWDPDPASLASLPRPPGAQGDGRVAWICSAGEQSDGCLVREGGAWRWNHRQPPRVGGGGLGVQGE